MTLAHKSPQGTTKTTLEGPPLAAARGTQQSPRSVQLTINSVPDHSNSSSPTPGAEQPHIPTCTPNGLPIAALWGAAPTQPWPLLHFPSPS